MNFLCFHSFWENSLLKSNFRPKNCFFLLSQKHSDIFTSHGQSVTNKNCCFLKLYCYKRRAYKDADFTEFELLRYLRSYESYPFPPRSLNGNWKTRWGNTLLSDSSPSVFLWAFRGICRIDDAIHTSKIAQWPLLIYTTRGQQECAWVKREVTKSVFPKADL